MLIVSIDFIVNGKQLGGNLRSQPACPARMDSNDITFLFFLTEVAALRARENDEPKEIASFVRVNDATGCS